MNGATIAPPPPGRLSLPSCPAAFRFVPQRTQINPRESMTDFVSNGDPASKSASIQATPEQTSRAFNFGDFWQSPAILAIVIRVQLRSGHSHKALIPVN
jgi:hypothetical protein